ncbi:MAG TPA: hypothetical protein VLB81_12670 [Gaiellales bacterium]|nr:hypothetical protein [Gaiellales bacterium]
MATKRSPEKEEPAQDGHAPVLGEVGRAVDAAQPAAQPWSTSVVVVGGFAAIAFCFAASLYVYRNVASATDSATAVATVLAPVTGVVGTVVGAYFGIRAGSAGTAAAQAAANEAQATALEAMRNLAAITAVTPAAAADQIHEILGVEARIPRGARSGF